MCQGRGIDSRTCKPCKMCNDPIKDKPWHGSKKIHYGEESHAGTIAIKEDRDKK